MSCLSDIDLATLHRNRLEERCNYKLMWKKSTTTVGEKRLNGGGVSMSLSASPSPNFTIRSSGNFSTRQINSEENVCVHGKTGLDMKKESSDVTVDDMNLLSARIKNLDMKWSPEGGRGRGRERGRERMLYTDDSLSSLENEDDLNYFASSSRRRRSGTWP